MSNTTNGNIAEQLAAMRKEMNDRLDKLENEIRPISTAYASATMGAAILKWIIGVLAGIATIAGIFLMAKGMK